MLGVMDIVGIVMVTNFKDGMVIVVVVFVFVFVVVFVARIVIMDWWVYGSTQWMRRWFTEYSLFFTFLLFNIFLAMLVGPFLEWEFLFDILFMIRHYYCLLLFLLYYAAFFIDIIYEFTHPFRLIDFSIHFSKTSAFNFFSSDMYLTFLGN